MAMLINYKYDKDHDYIVKSEISQSENQLDGTISSVVIYDRPLLNTLREAILADRSDYSALSGINPILKRNNAKKVVDSKYKLMKYEFIHSMRTFAVAFAVFLIALLMIGLIK